MRRIHLAVDPTVATVAEALEAQAQLLVTHHPLLLKGVHSVAATTPKGRVVHGLVTGGCALYAAHTNADSPVSGSRSRWRWPSGWSTSARWTRTTTWRRGSRTGARDAWVGCRRPRPCAPSPSTSPRCCPPRPTGSAWPVTRTSVVETVGLCGGAGDFLLDLARAEGVDVYVTSDLRHHPASELREHAAHWPGPEQGPGHRPWWTSPTGRRRAPGCRSSGVVSSTRWGIRCRSTSAAS